MQKQKKKAIKRMRKKFDRKKNPKRMKFEKQKPILKMILKKISSN